MILLHILTSEFFSILNKYCFVPSKALSIQRCVFYGDSSFPRQVSFRFPFLRESDLPWFRSIRCPASVRSKSFCLSGIFSSIRYDNFSSSSLMRLIFSFVMAFLPFGRCRLYLFPDYEFSFYKKRKQRNPRP